MALSPQILKETKYSDTEDRKLFEHREEFAKSTLALLGVDVECVGFGAGSSDIIGGFHKGKEDRFDFNCGELGIRFEVTGSGWTQRESAERYDPNWKEEGRRKASLKKAVLGIFKPKVDDAYTLGIQNKLYFVSVNDGDGSWRFMLCDLVRAFPTGYFAGYSEKLYHLVPWDKWRTPAWMKERLGKLRKALLDETSCEEVSMRPRAFCDSVRKEGGK